MTNEQRNVARSTRARSIVQAPGAPEPPGWSPAVKAGGWVFVAGTMATDFEAGLAPVARVDPRARYLQDALELQSRYILESIANTLSASDCDIRRDLIRVWQWAPAEYPAAELYERGQSNWPHIRSATPYARQIKELVNDPLRSSTGIGVRQLAIPGALMAVDAIAVEPQTGCVKQGFAAPEGVPQPSAGYSPATRFGDWVFLAGFGATDFKGDWLSSVHMGPRSMLAPEARVNPYIWLGSEIEAQTEYTLRALARIAEAAGTSLDKCVKADVTLTHPADFLGMDRVWRSWFPVDPPARNVVTGAQLVVKGTRVEIALVLLANDSKLVRTSITLEDLPAPPGHAPHAIKAGHFLFLSTLLPTARAFTVPAHLARDPTQPYFKQVVRRQSEAILQRAAAICEHAGTSLSNVCKVQAFFDDLAGLPEMLDSWRNAFPKDPPALTALGMGGGEPLLIPEAQIQMDLIALVP